MTLEMNRSRGNEEMARLGRGLVGRLFILFKTSLNYSEGHGALAAPLARVLEVVEEIHLSGQEASLRVRGGHLYLAEVRLKQDAAGFEAVRLLTEEMTRHHLGGISFERGVTAEELRRFVYLFRDTGGGSQDSYSLFLQRMQRAAISQIEVETAAEEPERELCKEKLNQLSGTRGENVRLKGRLLYRKALAAMDEAMGKARAGQPLRLREAKRVVQRMIDLLGNHEAVLLGLTTQRRYDPGAQNHAVNVCILSLSLGKRLGISKYHLCELGMAALFHDVGKEELAGSPGEPAPEEPGLLEAHPVSGVKKLMKLKGLDLLTSRIITGVFEHHLLADFSGYPRLPYRRLGLFGRVISIADRYDTLVSAPLGGSPPSAPDRAIRLLMSGAGKGYDRALLKLFIGCVGMHGIGGVLLLDSGELAVVLENHPDPAQADSPRVKVIADAEGREVDGELLDLALPETRRMILADLDPHPFNLEVSGYFL